MIGSVATAAGRSRVTTPSAKAEQHGAGVLRHRLADVLQQHPEGRVALRLQRLVGEHHVRGGDLAAVVPARLGPQPEAHPLPRLRQLDALRDQAVVGVRLVLRLFHQRLEGQQAAAGQERVAAGRRMALEDERVQRVERSVEPQHHAAALRRRRVDIVEVPEIGAVLQGAQHREAVPGNGLPGRRRARRGQEQRQCRQKLPQHRRIIATAPGFASPGAALAERPRVGCRPSSRPAAPTRRLRRRRPDRHAADRSTSC
jgi:hypothetical protein